MSMDTNAGAQVNAAGEEQPAEMGIRVLCK